MNEETPLIFGLVAEDVSLLGSYEFDQLWTALGKLVCLRAKRLTGRLGKQPWTPSGRSLAYRSDGKTRSGLYDLACAIEREAVGLRNMP